jgi:crotonobetainyl-CoA:carnitine CoA-transferase CaiB-like acyl-CoA transferase
MSLAFGIMVALFHRERTGEGQEVDASLLSGQLCIQTFNITGYLWSGQVPGRRWRVGSNPTWSVYQGSDGKWFALGMNREHYWQPICKALGNPAWIMDERFATLAGRLAHNEELFARFDELFATMPAAHWVRLFSEADLLATPVNDYADLAQDPQVLANDYITEVPRGDGEPPLRMVGLPVTFGRTPGRITGIGPEFGQHTEEVLLEAGFEWDEIAQLRRAGVIGPREAVEA